MNRSRAWVPRFLSVALAAAAPIMTACAGRPAPPAAEAPSGPPPVVLTHRATDPRDEARAAALVDSARAALAAGRPDDARATATRVVEELPATRVSGDALELVARASAEAGDPEGARAAAARLERLLPRGDERVAPMILLEARALGALGRADEALARLLGMPVPAPAEVRAAAEPLARELAEGLPREALGRVLRATPLGQPLAAPAMVAYARTLLLAGDDEGARRFARAALDAGATATDADDARALLEGRAPGAAGAPARLGALLPLSGSPALRTFAAGIREGIEAAVAAAGTAAAVQIDVLDSGGDAGSSAALVRSAEGQGVIALVGPLQDDAVAAAARARSGPLPMLSPTAYRLPAEARGVYSLGATDRGAARALAAWTSEAGIRQVVVLHRAGGESEEEAGAFVDAYQSLGGSVLRTLAYAPGATNFQEEIRLVHGLRPQALVLPVPPEDVVALAPQVTFYGLDTLGVQVLGTSGWTDEGILRDVSRRHLDAVVAATPQRPGRDAEGYRRFVEAYERHFQRTLVDPAVPALGWDAASLVLHAMRAGARTPEAVARALEDVHDFPGATGLLSIEDGRVVRRHQVVCLWGGELRPLAAGSRPEPVYRPHVADAETGIVPEGPGRRLGSRCPDVPPAAGG